MKIFEKGNNYYEKKTPKEVSFDSLRIHVYSDYYDSGIEFELRQERERNNKLEELVNLIIEKSGDRELWETFAAKCESWKTIYEVVD